MNEQRPPVRAVLLSERTRFGGESGAGIMRNRCAFTARDMGADWPEAFTYAIVFGWGPDPDDPDDNGALSDMAAKYGWDTELIAFLRDAHERFKALPDRNPPAPTRDRGTGEEDQ
jgi:hypothetical protein